MKKWTFILLILLLTFIISGCSRESNASAVANKTKIGIMLSDNGLGDQSYSDAGFTGLERARDELGIIFDYREIGDEENYLTGLQELVNQNNELIIGLGYTIENDLAQIAEENPEQQFVIIDGSVDLPNVVNVNFKEEEGSFLIGALAGLKTESDIVAFVGGDDTPLIHKFEKGFTQGVEATNPEAKVLTRYAGTFGDDQIGADIAADLIEDGADLIFPSAGFTGVGVIQQAEKAGIYSFGVDSDQFYLGEDTVITSMMKNIDTAVYNLVANLVEDGAITNDDIELGLSEEGVGLAPIRIINLVSDEKEQLHDLTEAIKNNELTVDK
ncbi:BMP family ABC transporter substrate-binding protein [Gracilibacillus sp. S3-1-1]|uniref:BMP family ABC transporter substrate-binding protein n=1 Tax=Gracilibacillus pellucidus TaxID=3095368 RepID=A0ACC6M0F6_9BACI|nr:BMP family ABC transporter substrate-binding protein [Gracilibacillus sp. S3-1-1]MDX8044421.1 BMP family ABC transporter substrate-binding protein [Gracilibacillus sp. S3-1-1]